MLDWGRPARASYALSGLWVAGVGFFLTRATVVLAVYETRAQFVLLGLIPLLLGLGLATLGVALVIGRVDPPRVRTIAAWCTTGTVGMGALVALVVAGAGPATLGGARSVSTVAIVSTFLIGGATGGTITGLYAGRHQHTRRQLRRQANQLVTINRVLRHEVLNAISIIRGRSEPTGGGPPTASEAGFIRDEADRIVDAIEDVKHLARTTRASREGLYPVDLGAAVEATVEAAREVHPAVRFTVDDAGVGDVRVWADERLQHALAPLVDNAARYNDAEDPHVGLRLAAGRDHACVCITDNGPGLPEEHRETLEHGAITDYDDPGAGFGTNLARMYLDGFGGDIETTVTSAGTELEVSLRVATGPRPSWNEVHAIESVGVPRRNLLLVTAMSLVAAVGMGAVMQAAAGVMPVIGALYGAADPLVGWVTHGFHSVVFGLVYVGLLRLLPESRAGRLQERLTVGLGWGLLLWVVAASLVMPIWLNLVGVPAPVPTLSPVSLGAHLLWGALLSVGYHLADVGIGWRPTVDVAPTELD